MEKKIELNVFSDTDCIGIGFGFGCLLIIAAVSLISIAIFTTGDLIENQTMDKVCNELTDQNTSYYCGVENRRIKCCLNAISIGTLDEDKNFIELS